MEEVLIKTLWVDGFPVGQLVRGADGKLAVQLVEYRSSRTVPDEAAAEVVAAQWAPTSVSASDVEVAVRFVHAQHTEHDSCCPLCTAET